MTAVRKPGRPPRSGRKSAVTRVSVRVTPDELERWRKSADDMPLSDWIRMACERLAAHTP